MLAQPVARSFDLNDDGVMKQAVKQSRGHHGIPEHRKLPPSLTGWCLTSR
jgi:hypothetical protein